MMLHNYITSDNIKWYRNRTYLFFCVDCSKHLCNSFGSSVEGYSKASSKIPRCVLTMRLWMSMLCPWYFAYEDQNYLKYLTSKVHCSK